MGASQLDLNLLFVLKRLLEEKHVSNTALSLNMSQSSVSRTLHKMRAFFDDELLVRTNYGYELTPKAETVKQDISAVINSVEKLVHKQTFDPKSVNSTVSFYGLQPQINSLMPNVIELIRKRAPNMVVSLDSTPKRHFQALIDGDVHFALSSHRPSSAEQNIHSMLIAKRNFSLLMSKNHPLANQDISAEKLREYQFGQISLQGEKTLSLEYKYKELGLADKKRQLSVPIQLSNFGAAPNIAAQTDIIFHVPTPFATDACNDSRLITRDVPPELKLHFIHVYLYWHKRFHDDPACAWIRSLFKELYADKDIYA
ncbi:LysR family transcriptional regulator [Shewanella sp. KX20019]|uniref:LysR family transcriptional regulator n=1 Tax=Shewanella sp. KX20019 TaxID=2803864 RepID=UPI0019269CBD|nr:LysR family transcriptional regulator [Shewanella sp. KX20019]QQX81017.1 LysR family transcriptional regulator [Shewanella sp. KX20019]